MKMWYDAPVEWEYTSSFWDEKAFEKIVLFGFVCDP